MACPPRAPSHAGTFEPFGAQGLASWLDDAGADGQAPGVGIAHAAAIAAEVAEHLRDSVPVRMLRAQMHQRSNDRGTGKSSLDSPGRHSSRNDRVRECIEHGRPPPATRHHTRRRRSTDRGVAAHGTGGRLRAGLRFSRSMIALSRAALRGRHPELDEHALRLLWIEQNYGAALARGTASPGSRGMDRHDDLAVALTPLIDALERLGVAWYVGGSVASAVHGRFRATNDVDVIANLREEHANPLRTALEADHFVCESTLDSALPGASSRRQNLSCGGVVSPTMSVCCVRNLDTGTNATTGPHSAVREGSITSRRSPLGDAGCPAKAPLTKASARQHRAHLT